MRENSTPFGGNVTLTPQELCIAFGLNSTITLENSCTIESICAEGGFRSGKPDQWWRFITPIFVHAGVIHLVFNMLFQVFSCRQMEREIGTWRMTILYLISGVGGNIFGANFASVYLRKVVIKSIEFTGLKYNSL
jgi:membrane associated rhomboid family serine protease